MTVNLLVASSVAQGRSMNVGGPRLTFIFSILALTSPFASPEDCVSGESPAGLLLSGSSLVRAGPGDERSESESSCLTAMVRVGEVVMCVLRRGKNSGVSRRRDG